MSRRKSRRRKSRGQLEPVRRAEANPVAPRVLFFVALLLFAGLALSGVGYLDDLTSDDLSSSGLRPATPLGLSDWDRAAASSSGGAGGRIESRSLAQRQAPPGGPMFESLDTDQTGIDFVHQWAPDNQDKVVLGNAFAGGGVCIGDYDSDGLPDVYLTRPHGGGQLYRNLGDFRFENVTDKAGVADEGVWGAGTTFVDIDNDEDLDLFVCGYECPNGL